MMLADLLHKVVGNVVVEEGSTGAILMEGDINDERVKLQYFKDLLVDTVYTECDNFNNPMLCITVISEQ